MTPGFQDTNLEDEKFLEDLRNNSKDINAGIRVICILLNFTSPRFQEYLQKQMRIYSLLFPIEDFWEHVALVFTKAYYHFPKEEFDSIKRELESENGLVNEIRDYIHQHTIELNKSNKKVKGFKKIKLPNQLPVYYIDSDLKVKENKNLRTKEEIDKLINWARNKEYLDLQNINKNKIDVNYISSKRIDDIKENDKKYIEGSSLLKIYSTKYYAQYEKTTFHNDIVIIKEPNPYKIEEIKENYEKQQNLISSSEKEGYQIFEIQHLAVKSEIRTTENGVTKEWQKIKNNSGLRSSRVISTDKLEIKTFFEETKISETKEAAKTIQIDEIKKIIKYILNGKEQLDKEETIHIHNKKITKEIIVETTKNKPFKENMEFCEDIVREEILTEYDDGTKPSKELKEKSRKKRFFKIDTF